MLLPSYITSMRSARPITSGRKKRGEEVQDEFDAVCSGLNLVDVLVRCTVPVTRGEKHLTEELVIQGGAPAGNAASVIASLGARTAFFGFFGENTLSRAARD